MFSAYSCSSGTAKTAAEGKEVRVSQQVVNPSFELAENGKPAGWKERTWDGKAVFAVVPGGRSGAFSASISSEEGADAALLTVVKIDPYCRYRLSGWIKTEGLEPGKSRGASICVNGFRDWRTPPVIGTTDWTRVDVEFDAGANDAIELACLFGGWGEAMGKAWFDDVELVRISEVEIFAARGQGRCPEDRAGRCRNTSTGSSSSTSGAAYIRACGPKCWRTGSSSSRSGGQDSPWEEVGQPAGLAMSDDHPYVGVHSPRLFLDGKGRAGLGQGKLAFVAGGKYQGRVILAGAGNVFPVMVSVVWGRGEGDRWSTEIAGPAADYKAFPFEFTAAASTAEGRLEITSPGRGWLSVGTVSLMPTDNVRGFRPEVVALLKQLDAPVYRWPGGNFVSGYDWRDGIGERDLRPPRKNPAWLGIEHNDVGVHEFLDLMDLIGSEPYITVNSGLGDVKMAADEVEYVNGRADTAMGVLRAKNGRPGPWKVGFWSIGNEMYGDWQLGHLPLSDYVKKHAAFAEAMRAVDPSIRLVAVGAVGEWSETMLTEAAGQMDLISEHFYSGEKPGLLSHVNQVPLAIRRIADIHRGYRETIPGLRDRPVPVALDEWNYWYGPEIYGEIGTQYFLKDALGIAAGINEYARQTDIYFMANYAQTVNVIGAIKTSKTEAVFDTTGLVLMLYRRHFGTVPVEVGGAPEPLDVMACLKEGGDVLTISVVNPMDKAMTLKLEFPGIKTAKKADLYVLTGDGPQACNVPGKPAGVAIREDKAVKFGQKIVVPPLSASLYEVKITR